MSSNIEFIEIRRVTSNKDKINNSVKSEVIPVNKIETFRAWYKGAKDGLIEGEMTIIIVKEEDDDKRESDSSEKKKVKSILIEEDYKDFLERLSARIPIRKLSDFYGNGKVIRYNAKQQTS